MIIVCLNVINREKSDTFGKTKSNMVTKSVVDKYRNPLQHLLICTGILSKVQGSVDKWSKAPDSSE